MSDDNPALNTVQPTNDVLNTSLDSELADLPTTTRKRKKKADTAAWKRNEAKSRREEGKSYMGFRQQGSTVVQDTPRDERKMGPPCTSRECTRRKNRKCSTISEEERARIFQHFWNQMNWDQKKTFVVCHVRMIPKKRSYADDPNNTRRNNTLVYFLTVNGEQVEVCKKLFLSTTALGEYTVTSWVKKSATNGGNGMVNSKRFDNSIRSRPDRSDYDRRLAFAKNFLDMLPKMPSHYSRSNSTKLFLEPGLKSLNALFDLYREECASQEIKPLSRFVMSNLFHDMNLSLHTLKKDKCDVCVQFEVRQITKDEWDSHIMKKKRAREEKSKDKRASKNKECRAFTMDLQAVKVSPFMMASAIFYKTKLCSHNFTVYDLDSRKTVCYWFDETAADLSSSTFVTCIIEHLEKYCQEPCGPIILWSDGCTYQNRNANLSNALSAYAIEYNVVIIQKYLIPGHTQMECDSVHSKIETELKGRDIYIPHDYIRFSQNARKKPFPYVIRKMTFSDFKDYTVKKYQRYSSIRPGKVVEDPLVTDLRALQYLPDGVIQYKLDFDSDWEVLPQRPKKVVEGKRVWPPMYKEELKIDDRKWGHLQELKKILPIEYHSFYDNLKKKSQ